MQLLHTSTCLASLKKTTPLTEQSMTTENNTMTKTKTLENVNPMLEFYYQQRFTKLSKHHGLNSYCQLSTDNFRAYFLAMEDLMEQFRDIAEFVLDNGGQATEEELRGFFAGMSEMLKEDGDE